MLALIALWFASFSLILKLVSLGITILLAGYNVKSNLLLQTTNTELGLMRMPRQCYTHVPPLTGWLIQSRVSLHDRLPSSQNLHLFVAIK